MNTAGMALDRVLPLGCFFWGGVLEPVIPCELQNKHDIPTYIMSVFPLENPMGTFPQVVFNLPISLRGNTCTVIFFP